MRKVEDLFYLPEQLPAGEPVNISRRQFLLASAGTAAGALVLGFGIPLGASRAEAASTVAAGTRVPAFLEIRPDNKIRLQCPFMEGGQGIFTAMAQIIGEELDADPAQFIVEAAPPGADYMVMNGRRVTGGSQSVRSSYDTMRRLGATTRQMLMQAASKELGVPLDTLTTEPGKVIHAASGRTLDYGQLAPQALDIPVPDAQSIVLRDPKTFRWIGKSIQRLDGLDKSTGRAVYSIDCQVEGMLLAAVQHPPRLGLNIGSIQNEDQVRAMTGVHSIHRLSNQAVAVVADRWWNAKVAVAALQVDWKEPEAGTAARYIPADFSTAAFSQRLAQESSAGQEAEVKGDAAHALKEAATVVEAAYQSQYVHHAQLEPPSALARFNTDGSLELWVPNQAPEMVRDDIAKRTGLKPEQIIIHSPLLGGFFGRHFTYETAMAYPQAIELAKAVGRPVKLIWSREEEFLRDTLRPMAAVRFRGGLDASGRPIALEAISACEGPTESLRGRGKSVDPTAVEGLAGKSYAIPHSRIAQAYVKNPVPLGYWRSVGNSMNDFFYEAFLDELAEKGHQDPLELRLKLLQGNQRLTHLLNAVVELSGGWNPGPFVAEDGSRRARGIAMASPFGSEAAAIAEVSIENGKVRVHDIWQAIDPGSIVNPAIINAQVAGATALGLSQVLLEEVVYEQGKPVARNYDRYPILPPSRMPQVHVRIVESGAKMGGIGEPPLPAVPPAVTNAVSRLTGQRIRSMPLSRYQFPS